MRLSELKAQVAEIAKDNAEALGEIKARLVKLQERIDELVAGNADPEVTDEAFTALLNQTKADAQALADIVPDETPAPTPPADGEPALDASGNPVVAPPV
jgi:hypothetical protein